MNRENEKLDIIRQVKLSFLILFPQKNQLFTVKNHLFPHFSEKKH